jgi:hypothetical protein
MLKQVTLCAALFAGATICSLLAQRALSWPAGTGAEHRCAEVAVDVAAPSPRERALACSAAEHGLSLLKSCGISLRRPLHIEIKKELRHPTGLPALGFFDAKNERAVIAQYDNVSSLVQGTPYALLPQPELYRSLIIHEVVHAVMHQNLRRKPLSHAAYEYPAYVLQIASLPATARDRFLQTVGRSTPHTDFLFSDSVLFMDPFVFAARAYHHFSTSAKGCAHLVALLEGEAPFILRHP